MPGPSAFLFSRASRCSLLSRCFGAPQSSFSGLQGSVSSELHVELKEGLVVSGLFARSWALVLSHRRLVLTFTALLSDW